MNQWIIVILVIAIVFAAMFFMLRGSASAQSGKGAAGSWLNGVQETKGPAGGLLAPAGTAADGSSTGGYFGEILS